MTRAQPTLSNFHAILAELGVSETDEIVHALGIGDYLGHLQNLNLLVAGQRQKLGELLRAAGRLTRTQLQDVIEEQKRSGRKLGDILVERSLLSAAECEAALAFQQHQVAQANSPTRLYLGNVLVASGRLSAEQLADGLHRQALHGGKLGDVLVAAGHLSEHHVRHGLQLQRHLLVALLIATLTMATTLAPTAAHAGGQIANLQVSTVIRPSAHLLTDFQATRFEITARDIARGYVEAPAASRFSVVTPKGGSYFVDFHPRGDLFQSVSIHGLGSQVELGADGGTVAQAGAGLQGTHNTLTYRFQLRGDVQAGVYDWPLLLAVRAR
jgi:hypothetical protein